MHSLHLRYHVARDLLLGRFEGAGPRHMLLGAASSVPRRTYSSLFPVAQALLDDCEELLGVDGHVAWWVEREREIDRQRDPRASAYIYGRSIGGV